MALENYVTMRDSVTDPQFQLKKELGFLLEQRWPARFVPRYSMVMFHRIPYAEAFRRGQIQDDILNQLIDRGATPTQYDEALAEELIVQHLETLSEQVLA